MNAVKIISAAREQISAMTGLAVDTVSGVSHDDKGWVVEIELIELRRIPNSSDVLATYHVNLDAKGNLISYVRVHRYFRGQVRT
jgi:hypothetical protein